MVKDRDPPQADGNASFLRAARSGNLDKVIEFLKGSIDINTSNANGLNALHLAAKEGHVHVVTELIKRGANVNAATKKGNTALHIASLAGQEEVVKVLIQLGANVNIQSQNGFTPLYMAAQENHDSVVSFLLASGANQSLATEDGFTPLAVALQQGHDKVVAVLLENDTKGKVRLPALHIAAKKDDCKAATLLLQSDHNPDVTSKSGFTPLHIAAHYGNENIAKILLNKGADVNYAAKHQITPLHVASKWGKINMVILLLDKGANIEAATRDGLTPLHCAARSGHDQVVDLLLEKGAPFLAKTKNGLAPLHMASQGDHVDSARILLYHKAPVDDVTVDYLTALHVAAHCGHVKVAKLLLDRKADPNARALNGFTPLHIACKKNRIKVVELLLKHGASIEATTESGLTPLHVASFMGCMNIVIYLIQNGANPDVPTVRGETPLHLAARANQTDIIRILLRNGASVDARAREEQTPLHIAARLGNVDIVSLLLQHGAAVDAVTKDMYTPLHITAKEDQEEVAAALLDHGASLTATTKKGFTPLHLAAKYGNIKVARLLLQKEAPVDAQGKNGVTPLHVAAHYNHVNVALLLLDKGASPHAMAKNGYTPLHIVAKKNQMDIASSLLEYGANTNAESKAGFTPLHLASQEGHSDMSALLIDHKANVNQRANNGLTPLHLCAQEDRVYVAHVLTRFGAEIGPQTKAGYTPLHVASHFGQINMVRFLLQNDANVHTVTSHGYTPLHQAAQQGHTLAVNLLLEHQASPNVTTAQGQTPLSIAQRLGYISVVETLKVVTETTVTTTTTTVTEEKYKVVAPETMQETFMTDSEDEGGEEAMLGDQSYRYLTADEMKSLGDDSLPIDVTKDEKQPDVMQVVKQFGAPMVEEDNLSPQHITPVESGFSEKFSPDNVDLARAPVHAGQFRIDDAFYYFPPKGMLRSRFLVSFMVDARGGAMRGCRHSGVRVIIPPRKASMPMRITCRYLRKEKLIHPPPLMEGEACASRILEMGPVGARFLGPVIIEVPHFASVRGKEREITILRSDTGESWREHTLEASEEAVQEVLNESFEGEELSALEDLNTNRITRILTTDFPQYFAIVTRIRQEVHGVGPEGGMVSSTVVPQVQAIFPEGALTKKIRVGLQAQPIAPELVAKLLGNRVAVSPIVTVEPRRRKFHKPITLTIPVPQAATKGMINQYSGDAPTLRLLCSITGGSSKAQWEDVTGSTPLTFVNDCVSFTTTVSARFWLMDCRQVNEVTRFATELYQEAVYVPFMSKFVIFAKRHDPFEAQLRVFCMTDDKEDKTLESQEHFTEVAKSRDVEVLEGKMQYLEFAGNLIPVTNSGEQLKLTFQAFHENRLPFNIRVKDPHMEPMGRIAFMKEPKAGRGDPPQTPICNLNVALPEVIVMDGNVDVLELVTLEKRYDFVQEAGLSKPELIHRADLRLSDIARELDKDWVLLARQLDVSEQDTEQIKAQTMCDQSEQARMMLRLWLQKSGTKATGNELEKGLRKINREDIIKSCMFNVELVTDDVEKAVAKVHLDQSGFDVFKEELGSSREASMRRGASLDVSYDEQDIMKEAESAAETSSETGSIFERDPLSHSHALTDERDVCASLSMHENLLSVTDSSPNCNNPTRNGLNSNQNNLETGTLKNKLDDGLDYRNMKNQALSGDHTPLLAAHSGRKLHNFWPSNEIIQEPVTVATSLNSNIFVPMLENETPAPKLDTKKQIVSDNNLNDAMNMPTNNSSGREMNSKPSNELPRTISQHDNKKDFEYVAYLEPDSPLFGEESSNFDNLAPIYKEDEENMVIEDITFQNGFGVKSNETVSNRVLVDSVIAPGQSKPDSTPQINAEINSVKVPQNNSDGHGDSSDLGYFSLDKDPSLSHIIGVSEKILIQNTAIESNFSKTDLLKKYPEVTENIHENLLKDCTERINHLKTESGEDSKMRRASKTPPPSPIDETIHKGELEKLTEDSLAAALLPETKKTETRKLVESEIKSIEATAGDSVMPSVPQDIPARLTESETWPSGDLDTSQVSVSSLPDDEKSEATATVSSTAAVTVDTTKKFVTDSAITEVDKSGTTTHIIQKTTHVTLVTHMKPDDDQTKDSASMPQTESGQVPETKVLPSLESSEKQILKEKDSIEHVQPLHTETSVEESIDENVEESHKKSTDDESQSLDKVERSFVPCAFVNTAFAGEELIDEVETVAPIRARSPYEVVRGEESSFEEKQDTFVPVEKVSYVTKYAEITRRPLLQQIPSEISEEDLVERELTPVSKQEFESFTSPDSKISFDTNAVTKSVEEKIHSSDTGVIKTITTKVVTTVRYGTEGSETETQEKEVLESFIKPKTSSDILTLKTEDVTTPESDTGIPTSPFELASESDGEHRSSTFAALSHSFPRSDKGDKSQDSVITTTQTQNMTEKTISVSIASSSKDASDSCTLNEKTESEEKVDFAGNIITDKKSDKPLANGPGEVEYNAEYDDIEETGNVRKIGRRSISEDISCRQRAASDNLDSETSKDFHHSHVSVDDIDAELREMLDTDQQFEDLFERPVTPEPPKDDLAISEGDFSQNLNRLSSGAIEDLSRLEEFVYSHDVADSPNSPDSKSGFAYGMQFEKYIIDQSDEAMDVDSDQYSEEKEPYGYGMRFERDPDLEEGDIPCYGDLYTHEEEDEEALENGEKPKVMPSKDLEFDTLAGRRFFTKNSEVDEMSCSSLQEFENFEADIVCGRKSSVGSIDSLNGKQIGSKSGEHDDVSLSSLTEFERLERECIEGEKIEPAMQESITQLSEIEEGHESQASETSQENKSDAGKEDDNESIIEEYNDQLDNIEDIILKSDTKESEDLPFQFMMKQSQKPEPTEGLIKISSKVEKHESSVSKIPKLKGVKTVVSETKRVSSWSKSQSLETSDTKDDLDQDSLRDEVSLKPDSLLDDTKPDFQDSLREEKFDDADSLQEEIVDEMRDSLIEEIHIEDDSLHDMDILPDESSLSLEGSIAAVASLDSSKADEPVMSKVTVRKSSKDNQDLGTFTTLHLEGKTQIHISDLPKCDIMQSSTDSLEQSSSAAVAPFQIESESVMSSSLNSAITSEDYTMVSSTDTLGHFEQEGRITYRYEDIPVDDLEMLIKSGHKVIVDSEGNIQTHFDSKQFIETDITNAALCPSKIFSEMKSPSTTVQVHSAVTTVKYVNGDHGQQKENIFHSDSSHEKDGSYYESSHYDPDLKVEEITTTDEFGNKKVIRKIKKVTHSKSQFSSSSSSKDVEEKMKEFLRDKTAVDSAGTAEEEIEEERTKDDKGNVVIIRTVKQQITTEPEVHSRTFTGPNAEQLSKDFVETFKSMDPTDDTEEFENIDEQGNVIRITKQFVVKPQVHSVSFSGPDAHKQMEEYMKQWNLQSQNLGEFEGDQQISTLPPLQYSTSRDGSHFTVSSDAAKNLVQEVTGDTVVTKTVTSTFSTETSERMGVPESSTSITSETVKDPPCDSANERIASTPK